MADAQPGEIYHMPTYDSLPTALQATINFEPRVLGHPMVLLSPPIGSTTTATTTPGLFCVITGHGTSTYKTWSQSQENSSLRYYHIPISPAPGAEYFNGSSLDLKSRCPQMRKDSYVSVCQVFSISEELLRGYCGFKGQRLGEESLSLLRRLVREAVKDPFVRSVAPRRAWTVPGGWGGPERGEEREEENNNKGDGRRQRERNVDGMWRSGERVVELRPIRSAPAIMQKTSWRHAD